MNENWSREEVEALVADYLTMLEMQLTQVPINKAQRHRSLGKYLNGRSEASISYKHRNVSAILIEIGFSYVKGYSPAFNYQGLLADVLIQRLGEMPHLEDLTAQQVMTAPPPMLHASVDILDSVVDRPKIDVNRTKLRESAMSPFRLRAIRNGVNYLELEARNTHLGLAGEEFVVAFERARLINSKQERLADRVRHVSRETGDGLGYDILSYEVSGRERLIEVKTTTGGIAMPFFVTPNEVATSEECKDSYHIYRLFDFLGRVRQFHLPGSISSNCSLEASNFKAWVA